MTPHEVWLQAVEGRDINLSKLARELGMRIATLWGYHTGRSRWPAETWVKAMKAVGYDIAVSAAPVPGVSESESVEPESAEPGRISPEHVAPEPEVETLKGAEAPLNA